MFLIIEDELCAMMHEAGGAAEFTGVSAKYAIKKNRGGKKLT